MAQLETDYQPDFGTGQKKLSIYIVGIISCALLTLLAFWAVLSQSLTKSNTIAIIISAACVQFVIQLICFLRLNVQTTQAKINVLSLVFTAVILLCIILGSLWIMWNLGYNMMH